MQCSKCGVTSTCWSVLLDFVFMMGRCVIKLFGRSNYLLCSLQWILDYNESLNWKEINLSLMGNLAILQALYQADSL